MASPDVADPNNEQRLAWADVAKGLCIILVVLHHLIGKHYGTVVPQQLTWLETGWMSMTYGLKALRMPLFFLLSGLFAASALRKPWTNTATRVIDIYYLYALWLCIHAVVFSFAQALAMNRTRSFDELLIDLTYASTGIWYLYALALYLLLMKALRPVDPRFVVAAAAVLAVVAPALSIDAVNRESVLEHFVYFAVGAYSADAVRRLAELIHRAPIAVLIFAYLTMGGLLRWLEAPQGLASVAVSLVAIPLAIHCAVTVSRWPVPARSAAFVGRRTLPIYVLHMPVLALLHHLTSTLSGPPSNSGFSAALIAVYPLGATVIVIGTSLLLHSVLARGRLTYLFRGPAVPIGHKLSSHRHVLSSSPRPRRSVRAGPSEPARGPA